MKKTTLYHLLLALMIFCFCSDDETSNPKNKNGLATLMNYNLADSLIIKQEMVLIPGGEFLMGSNNPFRHPEGNYDYGYPVREVHVDSFYIDKYEVTNAMYRKFVEATGHPVPRTWKEDYRNMRWDHPNQPVLFVSFYDAQAYTKWAGKRLPTEAEWEYAARGGLVQKLYPWGDILDSSKVNYNSKVTKPVGSYPPNGYGLYDMAGNVAEYTSEWYNSERVVYRNGGYNSDGKSLPCARRRGTRPNWPATYIGIRCAKDIK